MLATDLIHTIQANWPNIAAVAAALTTGTAFAVICYRDLDAIDAAGLTKLQLIAAIAIVDIVTEDNPSANYWEHHRLFTLLNKVTLGDHASAIFWNKDPRQLYHPDIQALWPAKETK